MHKLPGGKIALRSAHGSYLSATAPKHYGVVMQQESFNAWETFVLDRWQTFYLPFLPHSSSHSLDEMELAPSDALPNIPAVDTSHSFCPPLTIRRVCPQCGQ